MQCSVSDVLNMHKKGDNETHIFISLAYFMCALAEHFKFSFVVTVSKLVNKRQSEKAIGKIQEKKLKLYQHLIAINEAEVQNT